MLPFSSKAKQQKRYEEEIAVTLTMLESIYKNKSGDEYKMHGDITKSASYNDIERMVSNLDTIKNYPEKENKELHDLFNVLHRPIFKSMVTEYIAKPTERNTLFTLTFTIGYRFLITELSRVFVSTEAREDGIFYNSKIKRRNETKEFISIINGNIEKTIDESLRDIHANDLSLGPVQEGVIATAANAVVNTIGNLVIKFGAGVEVFNKFTAAIAIIVVPVAAALTFILKHIKGKNPITGINNMLMNIYDDEVAALDEARRMYEANKEAYDAYMKLPESQRNPKVVSKYKDAIEKYNIKVQNLEAKLAHYDQRAEAEAKEMLDGVEITNNMDIEKDTNSSNDEPNDPDFSF